MRAVLKNRQQLQAKYGDLVSVFEELMNAINTQPQYVGTVAYKSGAGTPLNKILGSVGDVYTRTDGGAGTTLYVKESGQNNALGWVAK